MSFDILIFDPTVVDHKDPATFIEWFDDLTEWEGQHDYNSPEILADKMRLFFDGIRVEYPPMNGPYAVDDDHIDDSNVADYTLTPNAVYVALSWSVSEIATKDILKHAQEERLAIFITDGTLFVPNADGKYEQILIP